MLPTLTRFPGSSVVTESWGTNRTSDETTEESVRGRSYSLVAYSSSSTTRPGNVSSNRTREGESTNFPAMA